MFGNIPPFFSPGYWPGGTVPNATTFKETVTFNKTAQSSAFEDIIEARTSDDSVGKLRIRNASGADGVYLPWIYGVAQSTSLPLTITGAVTTDSGTTPAIVIEGRTAALAALTTRPIFNVNNLGNTVLSALPLNSGANLCLSWGTQAAAAPAFTTRSTGTRLVLFNALSGSAVDCAIGIESGAMWYSVNQASSSYSHKFYAGTSNIASFRGDGAFISTGSQIVKFRVATTTPITVASGTDYIIGSNMAVAGAVAVSIPGAAPAGMMFHIKDVKGDAGINTITITPTSGTIDGAANKTITSNFGTLQVISDGTNYFTL